MTAALCHVQPQVLQCGALRQPDLGLHEIDAGHRFGDRVLDLQPRGLDGAGAGRDRRGLCYAGPEDAHRRRVRGRRNLRDPRLRRRARALTHARTTGIGQKVDLSLLGGQIRLMGWTLTTTMWADRNPVTGQARVTGTAQRPGISASFNDRDGKPLVFSSPDRTTGATP